ncbi:MAG: P1 family peptidase [Chloroflexi bacterium]|nr:P1 family peptidase [Chloroflexota bacterium]
MFNAITDVEGIRVGHYTDAENATGCTVILCPPEGAIAGADVRGPAPATRETDLLRPGHLVERVNAILLTGGSAFGLDAAGGVMRFLEERQIGYATGVVPVPIVPAAAIFDLMIGNAHARPTVENAYRACLDANNGAVAEGRVGAGTGASVGHLRGVDFTSPGGVGTASQTICDNVVVGALAVVNTFGDVVDPRTGEIIAGTRNPANGGWLDSARALKSAAPRVTSSRAHTTLGVVATNAALTKEQANLVAMMAHDGYARALRPAHAMYDGDTVFVLSVGNLECDVTAVGHTASEVIAEAIVRAVNS